MMVRLALLVLLSAAATQAAPPAPLCPPLPARSSRLTLGEQLKWQLDALGAELGTLEVELEPPSAGERGKATLLVKARAKTNAFVSTNVARYEAYATSLLTPDLMSLRWHEETDEGEHHRTHDIDFPPREGSLDVRSTRDGKDDPVQLLATPSARDMMAAFMALRAIPLVKGQPVCLEVYAGRRIWRLTGNVGDREEVETRMGKFKTVRMSLTATRMDDPKIERTAHFWIGDDARRLPVVAIGEFRGKTVRAQLIEASGRGLTQKATPVSTGPGSRIGR